MAIAEGRENCNSSKYETAPPRRISKVVLNTPKIVNNMKQKWIGSAFVVAPLITFLAYGEPQTENALSKKDKLREVGVEADESGQSNNKPAVYTLEGVKRIHDNILLLEQNIKDTETNLDSIEKNIATVSAESDEVKKIIVEHGELRKRLVEKVTTSKEEISKNDDALKKLQKFTKALDGAKNKQSDTQAVKLSQESAMREIAERERWNLDASQKLKRLIEMTAELDRSTYALRLKIPTLERELMVWRKQISDFQTALESFKKQRGEFATLLPGIPPSP